MKGKKVIVVDEKGGKVYVTLKDVHQSNGVFHVDHVLLPK